MKSVCAAGTDLLCLSWNQKEFLPGDMSSCASTAALPDSSRGADQGCWSNAAWRPDPPVGRGPPPSAKRGHTTTEVVTPLGAPPGPGTAPERARVMHDL